MTSPARAVETASASWVADDTARVAADTALSASGGSWLHAATAIDDTNNVTTSFIRPPAVDEADRGRAPGRRPTPDGPRASGRARASFWAAETRLGLPPL